MIELNELRNIVRKNKEELTKLLENKPEIINHVFNSSDNPLNLFSIAVIQNNLELVEELLSKGAELLIGDDFRNNLISKLLRSSHYDKPPNIEILKDG